MVCRKLVKWGEEGFIAPEEDKEPCDWWKAVLECRALSHANPTLGEVEVTNIIYQMREERDRQILEAVFGEAIADEIMRKSVSISEDEESVNAKND